MPIMYRLPQYGYTGHVVNLPQDVSSFAQSLPRLPSDLDVIVVLCIHNLYICHGWIATAHQPLIKATAALKYSWILIFHCNDNVAQAPAYACPPTDTRASGQSGVMSHDTDTAVLSVITRKYNVWLQVIVSGLHQVMRRRARAATSLVSRSKRRVTQAHVSAEHKTGSLALRIQSAQITFHDTETLSLAISTTNSADSSHLSKITRKVPQRTGQSCRRDGHLSTVRCLRLMQLAFTFSCSYTCAPNRLKTAVFCYTDGAGSTAPIDSTTRRLYRRPVDSTTQHPTTRRLNDSTS